MSKKSSDKLPGEASWLEVLAHTEIVVPYLEHQEDTLANEKQLKVPW
jgi:hypothetical protein